MQDVSEYISIESAGKLLGVSARTVRNWIAAGKLPAISGKRGRLVRRADVLALGRLAGKVPEEVEPETAFRDGSDRSAVEVPESDRDQQLALIRDTLLAPLIEQNERQQARLEEQAERIGRLSAERDQLETERDELRALLSEQQVSAVTDDTNASPEPSQRPWWRFWERS